jgi:hemerythrin-like domain-containing protein
MKATDILMNEHRVIEQVLSALEVIAKRAQRDRSLDSASAREVIDFFRTFADRCHHGKEERHLFPLLESRGMPRDGGPTGVMLHEHEHGRELLAKMASAIDGDSIHDFATAALAYVSLMRDHIWKEDQRLFQMAGRLLSAEDDEGLLHAFDTTEHADMGEGTHENYVQLADRLAARFGVALANAPVQCGCGCHH